MHEQCPHLEHILWQLILHNYEDLERNRKIPPSETALSLSKKKNNSFCRFKWHILVFPESNAVWPFILQALPECYYKMALLHSNDSQGYREETAFFSCHMWLVHSPEFCI